MPALFQLGQKPAPDFSDPVGLLEASHRRIEKHLALLGRALEAVRTGNDALLAEGRKAIAVALTYLDGPGAMHALDEEASVFPRIHAPVLQELALEHREHEAIYLALRTVATRLIDPATPPDDTIVADFEAHLRALAQSYGDHLAREELEVFPLVRALEPRELRAIGLEMRIRRGGRSD